MKKSRLLCAFCPVVFCIITTSSYAALIGRLPATPGGTDYQAAYDDVLNITWLTDADQSGNNTWANQVAWAANLNTLGFDDWRLASMSVAAGVPTGTATSVVDCSSATELACRDNELGYMLHHYLGVGIFDQPPGTQTIGDVTLTDIQIVYWSGTEFLATGQAWASFFDSNFQFISDKNNNKHGWAVRTGDVGAVPIPPAIWLFGSGLVGLIGVARRKAA